VEPAALRYVLVIDRAKLENTPTYDHRPSEIQRWRIRAQRLAELEGRNVDTVIAELRDRAHSLACKQREEALNDLARDLAVSRALGKTVAPPWQHRLDQLVDIMDVPLNTLREKVERLASTVEVVVSN
jgi:hypothetical protein